MFKSAAGIFKGEYFIFLLPLFFVLHGFTEHFASIPLVDVLWLVLEYVLISVGLCVVFYFIFRSSRKALLVVFYLMAFHFFYGTIHDSAKDVLGDSFLVSYSFILPLAGVLLTFLLIFFKRSKSRFNRVTRYLNVVLVLLIVVDIFTLANRMGRIKKEVFPGMSVCANCPKPDIYLVISDGYAGLRQLKDVFNFDNRPFEDSLRQLGFHVVDSSISNYGGTIFSMSSLLNMDYLGKTTGKESHEIMNQTRATKYLEASGYTIRNLSFFRVEDQFPRQQLPYFMTSTRLITNHTFYSRIDRDVRHNLARVLNLPFEIKRIERTKREKREMDLKRNSIAMDALFDELKNKTATPRFVYAHFLMPHGPYLFNGQGAPMPDSVKINNYYPEYLQYTNKKMLYALKQIIHSSPTPPVILFMSDHGYRNEFMNPDHQKFLNINAVYLPSKNYTPFYKGMSNVNQFRIIFNQLFQQKISMAKDSTVF
jgi:hypothetical protein